MNLDYATWVSKVTTLIFIEGYIMSDDSDLWDTIKFLYEDDATPEEAAAVILS